MKAFIKRVCAFFLCLLLGVGGAVTALASDLNKTNNQDGEITALKSNISNMELKGYVGKNIKNNVKFWQIPAYQNNKNIIDQIASAQTGNVSLSQMLGTDYFGVDNFFDIDIVPYGGSSALGWTMKSMPASFADRDIRFGNDANADTDWSGAKELWVLVDASQITSPVQIRLAMEENAVGRESYNLNEGARAIAQWEDGSKVELTALSGGFLTLPAAFKGYLRIPLDSHLYVRYWQEGGNGTFDLNNVVQFQMAVGCDWAMLEKTLYLLEFGVVGSLSGVKLPIEDSALEGYSYKKVWNFVDLQGKTGAVNSSLAWYGEFVGKLLTGMAFSYKLTADEQLKQSALEIIAELEKAQGEDGYLGVFIGKQRFSLGASNWDLWNHYHCIVGLLEWHKLTGQQAALTVAQKALECIYETFKDRSYLVVGGFETNRGIAHGYALMYQQTGEKKYLEEAERIIMQDCQDTLGWYKCALRGQPFYTSSSSRWEVLHMIMTLGILYEETGKQEYFDVMEAVWESILAYDIHNGGGFTTNEHATGDAFGGGVIETCCTIAWMAFTNEYYKYSKSVNVVDELERSYYNAMLGSLLEDDTYCTYNTPMDGISGSCGGYDGRRVASQQDISFQYHVGSPDMNCCQANLARGLGQLSEWAAVTDGNQLYLNYYGGSEITTTVGGEEVKIRVSSTYPESGKITVEIVEVREDKPFTLNLRIPGWAHGSTVTLDGKTLIADSGLYYAVERAFAPGDKITLDLKMGISYLKGEKSKSDYASVYYGPILLTLDKGVNDIYNQDMTFNAESLEKASVFSRSLQGGILGVTCEVDGVPVTLVDFASAGKSADGTSPSTYWSWLRVEGLPQESSDGIYGTWQQRNGYKVFFGDYLAFDKAIYNEGERVDFKPVIPSGYKLSKIVHRGTEVEIKQDGDGYYFAMPAKNIAVEVVLEKEQETQVAEPQEPQGCKSSILSSGILSASMAAGCVAVIAKKRKK